MSEEIKTKVTQVSVYRESINPLFGEGRILVAPVDESSGSFLSITGQNDTSEDQNIRMDWDEWDKLVEAVAAHRKEWEWEWIDE